MTPERSRFSTIAPTSDQTPLSRPTTHVLIVEDDRETAKWLHDALAETADGTVTTSHAVTMAEALAVLDRMHFDCVLLELGLHGTSDLDGLQIILDHVPGATVVVLTRRQNDPVASDAIRVGAQDHLCTHELSPHTLQRSVGYAVQRTRARLAERRLAMLLNRAAEVVLIIDAERVVTYASESIESVLGYPVDQVVGHPGAFFTHPDDLSSLRAVLMASILDPDAAPRPVVVRAVHADGTDRWGEVTVVNHLADPAIGGLVLNIRDITERHDITLQLEAEHAQRDAIVARSSDLVMFFESDGTITWASPATRSLFGVEPTELIGQNGMQQIHPLDRARVIAEFATITGVGDHVRTEFRILDAEGDVRWVEEIATNLVDDPTVGVVVGNLRDITDRRRAEEAVHFQARLLGAAGQAIVAYDDVGTVLYWNTAACDTFGWTEQEAIGEHVAELIPAVAGWEEKLLEILPLLRDAEDWSGEFRVHRKDGVQVPVEVSHTPLFDDDGGHLATIGVYSDITDRLQSETTAALLSSIVESSNDAIFSNDVDGSITTWNSSAADLYGHTASEVIGCHLRVLAAPERSAEVAELLARLALGESVTGVGTLCRHADGTDFHVSMSMSPLLDPSASVIGASTIARDISERVELTRQIEEDRRRLAEAQASAMLGSFEIDLATGHVTRSAELYRILGREPGSLDGVDFDHIHHDDLEQVHDAFDRAIAGEAGVECTHRILRPDGEVRWVVSRSSGFTDGTPGRVGGTMLDITERREAELAIEHLAYHDALTGLANRTTVTTRLDDALVDAGASGHLVAVALIDIDQFKTINDTLGHSAGDTMLRAVARRLESAARPGETLARFGGDEFAVVRTHVDGPEACEELGERLLAAFTEPIPLGDRAFRVTISVGLALGHGGDTADAVFLDADTAMYHAKDTGRDRAAVFDQQLQVRSRRRRDVEDALRDALDLDQLSVVFQPVIDLATLHTSGFEALLRWNHPELGVLRPDEFIPIAEETGLILSIGEWVLRRSLRQAVEWHRLHEGGPVPWIAVNLSARQLEQVDLVDHVAAALHDSGLPAEYLHLEITESILMDTIEHSLERLLELRELGIRLSIDDFGTGYSSLSYLKRLPIDTLKIDRSFIDGLGTDPEDTSIVQTIMSLATTLHLRVLAEGVEDETQLQALIDLGCDYGQGFLWSHGVPPDLATPWIDR